MGWNKIMLFAAASSLASVLHGADYYVSPSGSDSNDGLSSGSAFATIDKAISTANANGHNIFVAPGEYETTTQYGPNLQANLIGLGATPGEVVLKPAGSQRTLRMASGSLVTNVTVVGQATWAVDKGGGIEMNGGTLIDCVLCGGTAKSNSDKNAGGNIFVGSSACLIENCEIYGGASTNRGGNVCLNYGTMRNCKVYGGIAEGTDQVYGGNVFSYQGKIESCEISGGSAAQYGGNVYLYHPNACLIDSSVSGGSAATGGNVYVRDGGTISGNTLTGGNAAYGANVKLQGTAVCIDNVIEGGEATSNAGAVSVSSADCAVTNNVISCGTAAQHGGNVHLENGAIIVDCVIFDGTAGHNGGNVFAEYGSLVGCVVSNGVSRTPNSHYQGGGNVFFKRGLVSRCVIANGTVENGYDNDPDLAGGIHVSGSDSDSRVIEDTLFVGNAKGALRYSDNVDVYNCDFIDNTSYAVYAYGSRNRPFVNCAFFNNLNAAGDALRTWVGTRSSGLANIAADDSGLATVSGYVSISSSDFADYANGDYSPVRASAMVNAGVDDTRADASELDLAGNARLSGKIDIGCYEYQLTELAVALRLVSSVETVSVPKDVTFAAGVQNAEGDVSYMFDFGDGTIIESSSAEVTHTYTTPGRFTVSVTADDGFSKARVENTDFLTLYADVWVSGSGSATVPYDTAEKGLPTLAAALALSGSGYQIRIAPGVYEQTAQHDITKAVRIAGAGATPGETILRNTNRSEPDNDNPVYNRVFQLNNAGILVENLAMENGFVRNNQGGNLRIVAGVVSNCVIRGGLVKSTTAGGGAHGGAVELAPGNVSSTTAVLTHCWITNNAVRPLSSSTAARGAAVYVANGSKMWTMSNCLVAYNTYEAGDSTRDGSAGVYYGGSNENSVMENCTIASNVVVGALSSDCAAIQCGSWTAKFRNNAIAANWETGKAKATSVNIDSHCTVDHTVTDLSPEEMFRDFAKRDFRPKTGGPLVDAGATPYRPVSVDLAGNARVLYKAIDIGCFETENRPGFAIILR